MRLAYLHPLPLHLFVVEDRTYHENLVHRASYKSGGDIRFNFLIQDGKQSPGDSIDPRAAQQVQG